MTRIENVVVWPARTDPGNRVIPAHLKLAILSRGRVLVPPATVAPLIARARSRGESWPDRLGTTLERIFDRLPLTVELFLMQRRGMSVDQIEATIQAYLTQQKARSPSRCAFIEWMQVRLHSVEDRTRFEKQLDLDTSLLFSRARVTLPPAGTANHLLLAYVCVPESVQRILRADPKLTAPLLPSPQLRMPTRLDAGPKTPPLLARTDPKDELHLRDIADAKGTSLGVLAGHEAEIKIHQKKQGPGAKGETLTWYDIELLEPLSVTNKPVSDGGAQRFQLPIGQRAWLSAGGIKIAAAPWNLFRRDLRAWEATQPLMGSVAARITLLRQRSHDSSLIFDEVIGTPAGTVYHNHLTFAPGPWQLLLDYEAVITPDGRWVDLQHLLVGLDVLGHAERQVTVRRFKVAAFDVGTNWTASTWAGDLGSVVADRLTQSPGAWRSFADPKTETDVVEFFLHANAAEWDLLGDLDPWGMLPILRERSDVKSIDDLLALYYEDLFDGIPDFTIRQKCPMTLRPLVRRRAEAIRRFLVHYGFEFPVEEAGSDDMAETIRRALERASDLEAQGASAGMQRAIHQFAMVWLAYRSAGGYATTAKDDPRLVDLERAAVKYFLFWLDQEAVMHCVDTRTPDPVP